MAQPFAVAELMIRVRRLLRRTVRDVEAQHMSDTEPAPESDLIHRLKNHLCIIAGFCELLLRRRRG